MLFTKTRKSLKYFWFTEENDLSKWIAKIFFYFEIYAEVEILVASYMGSKQWQCFIIHLLKITTHKMRSFDDVLLFSMKSKMLKITRITWKENSFEFYSTCVCSISSLPFGGGGSASPEQCGCHTITLEQRFSTDGFQPANRLWQIWTRMWAK